MWVVVTSRHIRIWQIIAHGLFDSKVFKKKIEDDIKSDTSGNYRKLLVTLLNGNRAETNEVNLEIVDKDVEELLISGIKRWGTDESKFNAIFGTRRYVQEFTLAKNLI